MYEKYFTKANFSVMFAAQYKFIYSQRSCRYQRSQILYIPNQVESIHDSEKPLVNPVFFFFDNLCIKVLTLFFNKSLKKNIFNYIQPKMFPKNNHQTAVHV